MKEVFKMVLLIGAFLLPQVMEAKNPSYLEYIDQYYPIAVDEMQRTGIPASIKLAQGILESNAGRSYLSTEANNHFGIKCGNDWNGKKKFREDDDYDNNGRLRKSCFRAYDSPELSYYAHSQFLKDPRKAHRYGFLFELESDDYKAWARGLQRSGYATNPKYASLLITLIEQYELYQYDTPIYKEVRPSADIASFTYKINGADVLEALQGDTPSAVADRMQMRVDRIIKYNEALHHPAQPLEKGFTVYLQRKRNKYHGKKRMHIVRPGETVFDISQQYGVKEDKIRKRNGLSSTEQPRAGEYVYLQGRRSNKDVIKTRPEDSVKQKKQDIRPKNKTERVPADKGTLVQSNGQGEFLNFTISPSEEAYASQLNGASKNQPNEITRTKSPVSSSKQKLELSTGQMAQRSERPIVPRQKKYQVKKGDTLYRISRMYDMTVDELKERNGLSGTIIQEGQWLIVRS